MAGLRKLRGKYYARINYRDEKGKYKEKLIPLHTKSKAKANRLFQEVEKREELFKNGILPLTEISFENGIKTDELMDEFLEYLKLEGDSERTLALYDHAFQTFLKIFPDKDLSLLSDNDYLYFLSEMKKRYPNDHTLNIRLSSIRAFFNWCVNRKKVKEAPFSIRLVRVPQKLPRYFNNTELKLIFERIKEMNNQAFYARVKVHLNTGMRLGELNNAYIQNSIIHVFKSKTKTERSIPVDPETEEYFNYLKNVKNYADETVSKMFVDLIRKLGLYRTPDGVKRSFHCLRHTFAVKTYYHTRDIYRVSKLLGHSTVTTTEIYASFDLAQLERDFGDEEVRELTFTTVPISSLINRDHYVPVSRN